LFQRFDDIFHEITSFLFSSF